MSTGISAGEKGELSLVGRHEGHNAQATQRSSSVMIKLHLFIAVYSMYS